MQNHSANPNGNWNCRRSVQLIVCTNCINLKIESERDSTSQPKQDDSRLQNVRESTDKHIVALKVNLPVSIQAAAATVAAEAAVAAVAKKLKAIYFEISRSVSRRVEKRKQKVTKGVACGTQYEANCDSCKSS